MVLGVGVYLGQGAYWSVGNYLRKYSILIPKITVTFFYAMFDSE